MLRKSRMRRMPFDVAEVTLQPVVRCISGVSRDPASTSERKTGLYVRNVETARLVRDERGWLRMAD